MRKNRKKQRSGKVGGATVAGSISAAKVRRKPKVNTRDSVFRDLFSEPKYLLQMYKALHPEDTDVTEADISNVTIKNVLLNQMYNDCSFTVRDKLVVLVECQSTWSINILVRLLMYLVEEWHRHIIDTGQNIYGSKRVQLPAPEFYVLFIGDRADKPDWINLSDEFFDGKDVGLDIRVHILYGDSDDILGEFVGFSKVYVEQIKNYGRTEEAILETLRICREKNYLSEYLAQRESEGISIMKNLFDDDFLLKVYGNELKEEGREEGRQEGREIGLMDAAKRMLKNGMKLDAISQILDIDSATISKWIDDNNLAVAGTTLK